MRTTNVGVATAACVVTISVAACGSPGGKFCDAGAVASSSATSAIAPATSAVVASVSAMPATSASIPVPTVFTDTQLLDALLAPDWGSGWSHVKNGPITGGSEVVGGLALVECWSALNGVGA